VAAINWGLVAGKTQTYLPWDSWQHPYTDHEPPMWFHEIFRNDGTPYKQEEVNFIRDIIAGKLALLLKSVIDGLVAQLPTANRGLTLAPGNIKLALLQNY
jgi:hypothetical protein